MPLREDSYPFALWLSVASALLGSFQFGFHLGVLNTSLSFVAEDLGFDVTSSGAVAVSALLVGASFGSLTAGQIADKLGPGRALQLNNLSLILGCLLALLTPFGYWGLLAGRFFVGIGAGAASLYVPRFITEIAPASIRGQLSTFNQVFVCLGILAAYAVGWPYSQGHAFCVTFAGLKVEWWRIMFLTGIVPAVLQVAGMGFSPESPVWLQWMDRPDQAVAAEKALLGARWEAEAQSKKLQEADGHGVEERLLSDSEQQGEEVDRSTTGWSALLHRRYRHIMTLAAGLPLLQQGSGINTVILYSSQVFALAGLSSPVIGSVIVGVVQVIATLVAAKLADTLGRRPLLLVSHAGMGICLGILSLAFLLPLAHTIQGQVAFGAVLLFVLFYSLGSGPIVWVYLPEILPDAIKGRAAASCTCLNWVANLLIGLSFPTMLKLLHISGSYLIFAVINALGAAFVWGLVVETKQRSLSDIQRTLELHD